MARPDLVAGIDVGGTNLRVAVADVREPVRLLAHRAGPMPTHATPEACIEVIDAYLNACCAEAGLDRERIAAAVSTVPGITDAAQGTTLIVTNLPGWDGYPLAERLSAGLRMEARIENDVNAAAIAEYFHGAGAGAHSLAYLTVSTGVAAGFVIEGQLLRGYRHAAGELGFLVPDSAHLDGDWRPNGCLELTAAGVGLARYWAMHTGNEQVTAIDVFAAARDGHEHARWLVQRAADYLAQTAIAIAAVINPEVLVLGGSIALHEPIVKARIASQVARAFPFAPRVVDASFEGNAPIVGALAIAARVAQEG
ncbi:MAG: ROK family protein [Rhodothermales bacterium]